MTDRTSSLVTACHGHCWLWYQGQGVMLRDLQKPFWAGTVSQTLVLISSAIGNFLILPWVTYGGRQVHRYCNGLGSFVENLVSYVFLVLLCLHTHCRPLDHLQGKTGLILCRFLPTTVLNNWLFEVSALPLSIYSSTLLTRSKGGLALTVLLEHVLGFLLGKPFFLVFGT